MKALQFISLLICAGIFASCETTTQTTGTGNQEQKRLAALQQQQPQSDESEQNLQNAQADVINRGTNPGIRY